MVLILIGCSLQLWILVTFPSMGQSLHVGFIAVYRTPNRSESANATSSVANECCTGHLTGQNSHIPDLREREKKTKNNMRYNWMRIYTWHHLSSFVRLVSLSTLECFSVCCYSFYFWLSLFIFKTNKKMIRDKSFFRYKTKCIAVSENFAWTVFTKRSRADATVMTQLRGIQWQCVVSIARIIFISIFDHCITRSCSALSWIFWWAVVCFLLLCSSSNLTLYQQRISVASKIGMKMIEYLDFSLCEGGARNL